MVRNPSGQPAGRTEEDSVVRAMLWGRLFALLKSLDELNRCDLETLLCRKRAACGPVPDQLVEFGYDLPTRHPPS